MISRISFSTTPLYKQVVSSVDRYGDIRIMKPLERPLEGPSVTPTATPTATPTVIIHDGK
jgi:hypothetical protein